jgi:hypothetical protein
LDDAYAGESQGFGAAGQHDRRLRKSRIGEDSEADIRKLFKRNILDSLGCAIAGLPGAPFAALREQFAEKNEQQLVQIRLSKQMIPRTHCRVPDDCLSCFETKFHMVGKWTESTL